MRLLFVTYFFPPFKTSAAVRTGQTAKYLTRLGHEVYVVTADQQSGEPSLSLDFPRDRVVYTPWLGSGVMASVADQPAYRATEARGRGELAGRRWPVPPSAKHLLRSAQRNALYMPDDCIGWYPWALHACLALMRRHKLDLIYASAGPYTSFLVAASAARLCRVPWAGELRDLWTDNHYRDLAPWLRRLDARVESLVLGSAAGLVTMSQPWAELLGRKYPIPVRVIYNGFDERAAVAPAQDEADPAPLVISHLGRLYGEKRDPVALFAAVRALGAQASRVRVDFYGPDQDHVRQLARASGVADRVRICVDVPYAESLAVQSRSDVLLLLMWDTPEEAGVLPGKLFEYLGAGKPVLAVGAGQGVAARLISSRRLGLASSDPVQIAGQLKAWIAEKDTRGRLATVPKEAVADFSRARQVRKLSEYLCELSAGR